MRLTLRLDLVGFPYFMNRKEFLFVIEKLILKITLLVNHHFLNRRIFLKGILGLKLFLFRQERLTSL